MNWGRRIAVATLVCAGGLAIALLLSRSREPVYQGHTLSWWINQYGVREFGAPLNPLQYEPQRAIQQIGTNAVPTLLEWIRYDEPTWRTRLIDHLNTPGWGPAFLHKPAFKNLAMGARGRHAREAVQGFHALGPALLLAAAELDALSKSKSPFVRWNATDAWGWMIGEVAMLHIDPDINVRRAATNAFRIIGMETVMTPAPPVPNTAPDKVTNSVH